MDRVPRDTDRYLQRIMDNASGSNDHNRSGHYAFGDRSIEYSGLAPGQHDDLMLLDSGSYSFDSSRQSATLPPFLPSRQSLAAASTVPASESNPSTFNVPYSQSTTSEIGPLRVSLVPQSMYQQQAPESRALSNADSRFRFAQNLRHGYSMSQAASPSLPVKNFGNQQQVQSPLTQLANNIFAHQIMSQGGPDAAKTNNGPRFSRVDQLQPRRQEPTPPFNLSGFISPNAQDAASSPPPAQPSSPTARFSLRRATNRLAPVSRAQEDNHGVRNISGDPTDLLETPGPPSSSIAAIDKRVPQALALRHAPPMAQGVQLISPHELPDRFRQVFPYELFNAVQSKCFTSIYKSNDNVVVSAPTGSGKTVLLELAICKLVEGNPSGQFKIVYQAPTKSLCSERMRDWQKKFSHLNLACAELTGDTGYGEMSRVGAASIIVTTPEKWDSITRKWKDYSRLLQMVKLFLIDEVHIVKDTRGATLEAVVSRMKTSGAMVRFVALSATVPNSQDIALWLGKDHTNDHIPAHRETFGEDFRPVKLQKHVYGFDGLTNAFAFEKILDGKLPNLIQKHAQHKPIMVFCFTRKSCEATASILAEWWSERRPVDRAWPTPAHTVNVESKELQELVGCGVAFHHAGLALPDRHAIETAFLKGDVSVICCTSTLAVGVNLPCHLVVLKGTVCFQDGSLCEYSDLEVMQMLGRAGRPQFDDSAVAIIMTRSEKADRYKKMISGQDVLESTLHLNLIEHLNSEVGLGTIQDLYTAKKWLTGTFLSVRMRQSPNYYKLDGVPLNLNADERLGLVCERDIKLLQDHDLVKYEGDRLIGTEYGQAMSRYMVSFDTMKLLLSLSEGATIGQILHLLCQATEFKDLRMKPNERASLREFNKSPFIKFPIKENISTTAHKISLMIQVQLGGVDMPSEKEFAVIRRQYLMEKGIIFERIQRLIRCIIDCRAYQGDAVATRHALDLARSLSAEYWENSNLQLRQVPQIGHVAHRKLVSSNINSIEKLRSQDTGTIERIVGKNPPFGNKIKTLLAGFPSLRITSQIIGKAVTKAGQNPIVHINVELGFLNDNIPVWNSRRPSLTFMAETSQGKLVHFWRGTISKIGKRFDLKFSVTLENPEDSIKCHLACDEIVGTLCYCRLDPNVPMSAFPARKLRQSTLPVQMTEAKAERPGNDEFGTDDIDDDELLAAAQNVETPSYESDSERFADIDDFSNGPSAVTSKKICTDPPDSVQMENGKWTCNHPCRDGTLLKSGQKCKHKCCAEGLDKPRRVRPKSSIGTGELILSAKVSKKGSRPGKPVKKDKAVKTELGRSQPRFKVTKKRSSGKEIELVNPSDRISTETYPNAAPRDYHKLHNLHASTQKSDKSSIHLLKQKPRCSYRNGVARDLPFLGQSKDEQYEDDLDFDTPNLSDEKIDFPSPSCIIDFTGEDLEDPFQSGNVSYEEDFQASGNFGNSLPSLEAGMLDMDESVQLRAHTPKINSSFANGVFDFEAFEENYNGADMYSSPAIIRKRGRSQTPSLPDPKQPRLTQSSEAKPFIQIKQQVSTPCKVPNGENGGDKINDIMEMLVDAKDSIHLDSPQPEVNSSTQQPPIPSWVSDIDFDADLIKSLIGVVDFVE